MTDIQRVQAVTTEIARPSTVLLRSRAAVVVALVAALLLTIGATTEPAWLRSIDMTVSESIRGWGGHAYFRIVTHLGSVNGAIIVGVLSTLVLWKRCRPMALAIPGVVAAAMLLDVTLKVIIDRDRPMDALISTNLGSFPSGHVIMAVAVLGLLVPAVRIVTGNQTAFRAAAVLLIVGTTLTVLSRINLGAHWPSDVAASLLIGASLLLFAEYVLSSQWACNRCDGCGLHQTR
jgi:undecaprenyl-diphosphatase